MSLPIQQRGLGCCGDRTHGACECFAPSLLPLFCFSVGPGRLAPAQTVRSGLFPPRLSSLTLRNLLFPFGLLHDDATNSFTSQCRNKQRSRDEIGQRKGGQGATIARFQQSLTGGRGGAGRGFFGCARRTGGCWQGKPEGPTDRSRVRDAYLAFTGWSRVGSGGRDWGQRVGAKLRKAGSL